MTAFALNPSHSAAAAARRRAPLGANRRAAARVSPGGPSLGAVRKGADPSGRPLAGQRPRAAADVEAPEQDGDERKKVSIVQLGCPKNIVDGEVMLGDLYSKGFDVVSDHEAADAIMVNTCAFVEDAKNDSIQAILDAAALGKEDGKKIVVTGCLAQRYGEELASELPEADIIMGFENYGGLPATLADALGKTAGGERNLPVGGRIQVGGATVPFRSETQRMRLTPNHLAYLRVAEGCDHKCSFCAIPGFRGKFRSKPWESVVEEAKALAGQGVRELNLIAEDTNQYGMDLKDGRGLAQLLEELNEVDGLEWIRILYAYPSYFGEDLVQAIADVPKVCKYIDIPLQHIANTTLLGMNRPTQQHTMALLNRLREGIPGLALRTTFISGFPGETERDHRELVDFVRDFKFERLGVFAYSEEDGTPAAEYPGQLDQETREARRDELISLQQDISSNFARSRVGQTLDVLVDGKDGDGQWLGRTSLEAPDIDPVVFLTDSEESPLEAGQMRKCEVTSASIFDLEASPVAFSGPEQPET